MTTKTNIELAELAEEGPDTDRLRDMIQYVAQRLMEFNAEGFAIGTIDLLLLPSREQPDNRVRLHSQKNRV